MLSLAQPSDPQFAHLTTNEGLSHNRVNAILKDHKGLMWFATEEGLNKYDGYRFATYKHNTKEKGSICSNFVLDILEDKSGDLWVGTASGLDRL